MPTKTKATRQIKFAVRRIANRNSRHARKFFHAHRHLSKIAIGFFAIVFAVGGLLSATGNLSGGPLQASSFSIGGSGSGWSVNLSGGDTAGPAFDGPGATSGLTEFATSYKGNTYSSAVGMIVGWTNFVLPFVSVLAIAALVYAGFLYVTALGNDEQTGKAKNIILWVVIGIVLIFSAYAIVNTITSYSS